MTLSCTAFDEGLASRVPYESAARTLTQRKQTFSVSFHAYCLIVDVLQNALKSWTNAYAHLFTQGYTVRQVSSHFLHALVCMLWLLTLLWTSGVGHHHVQTESRVKKNYPVIACSASKNTDLFAKQQQGAQFHADREGAIFVHMMLLRVSCVFTVTDCHIKKTGEREFQEPGKWSEMHAKLLIVPWFHSMTRCDQFLYSDSASCWKYSGTIHKERKLSHTSSE